MIEFVNVYKSYQKVRAASGISFQLKENNVFGVVGPEHSGKTTILKICAGLVQPDEGIVLRDNKNIFHNPRDYGRRIGYMPQKAGIYEELTVREYLEFYARIYGMDERSSYRAGEIWMNKTGIREYADMTMDMLTQETKQYVGLARCMIHQPELFILDEPFQNLNRDSRFKMLELIMKLKKDGTTILISSDSMEEMEELCSEIAVLENGRIVVSGSVKEVIKEVNISRPLMIKVLNKVDEAVMLLKENPYVRNISISGCRIAVRFDGGEKIEAQLLNLLVQKGIPVSSFVREKGRMEDVISKVSTTATGGML